MRGELIIPSMSNVEKVRISEIRKLRGILSYYYEEREEGRGRRRYGLEPAFYDKLDELFNVRTVAPVLVFDMGDQQHGNGQLSGLGVANEYGPIFGNKKARRSQSGRNDGSLFDRIDRDRDQYGEPGDNRRLKYYRKDEAEYMARVLFTPPRDIDNTFQRQRHLETLVNAPELDRLINLKNKALNLAAGLADTAAYIQVGPVSEESLIDMYYLGVRDIPIYEERFDFKPSSYEPLLPLLFEAVDTITVGLEAVHDFAGIVQKSQHSSLGQVFTDLPSFIDEIEEAVNDMIPMSKAETPEESGWEVGNAVWNLLHKKIEPYLKRVGALLEFAKRIRDENWGKVSFDSDLPEGYKNGWNLERPKNEQVLNSSPQNAPFVIFSGANTSGKSFAMKSDMLIRLSAQALGHAPVESGNLNPHSSFLFLDRASTDPDQDLSAFMREIENWKAVLPHVGDNARLYVDEGYSTTSPEDQARLLLATGAFVRNRSGSIVLATHNDLLLTKAGTGTDAQIFHLHTEIEQDGKLRRHFKISPGVADSFAVAVAKTREFPPDIVDLVESYLAGQLVTPEKPSLEFPVIEYFDAAQREQMKTLSYGFEGLFSSELNNPLFHLFSRDPDFRVERFLQKLGYDGAVLFTDETEASKLKRLLGSMILLQHPLTSEEILERQQMIQQLLVEDRFIGIRGVSERMDLFEASMGIIQSHAATGVNISLNPFPIPNKEKYPEAPGLQFSKEALSAAIAFMHAQQKILRGRFNHEVLLHSLEKVKALFDDMNQRGNKILTLTSEETAQLTSILSAENQERYRDTLFVYDAVKDLGLDLLREVQNINAQLPLIPFDEIFIDEIAEELKELEQYGRGSPSEQKKPPQDKKGTLADLLKVLDLAKGGLPLALLKFPEYQQALSELIPSLKGIDSVYLNQMANFIDESTQSIISNLQGETTQEDEVIEKDPSSGDELSIGSHLQTKAASIEDLSKTKKSKLEETLQQLGALCLYASIIKTEGFSPVKFNDTGEVKLVDAANIFKKKGSVVKNTVSLNGDERLQLFSGPNGSGKTFHQKGAVAAVLTALATGFAPATSATMPIFDSVSYLDRVTGKQNQDFSSFSQELEYWNRLVGTIRKSKAAFIAADEAFSTTSPRYQAAFTYAVVNGLLENNVYFMLSSHNHYFLRYMENLGQIIPYHFDFTIHNGKIVHKYQLRRGHEASYAVEVARSMGLPEDILNSTM